MASYTATITWARKTDEPFTDNRYARAHDWAFDGGVRIRGSSSPHVVPRFSDPAAVDPEEALVAALSSCHMLTFLHLAAKAGHVIERYEDKAEGVMARRSDGRFWVSRVTLHPRIAWGLGNAPDLEAENALHRAAHEECFIANSVLTEVVCSPIR
jgi:organic hydroperoxide reductase OsmC/OhrA